MITQDELLYWLGFINHSGLKLSLIKPIIQRWVVHEGRPLSMLFGLSSLEWQNQFGLSDLEAQQAQAVPQYLAQQAEKLAAWQAQGIKTLTYLDHRYPKRWIHALKPAQLPLLLWLQGADNLLNEPTLNILGENPLTEETQTMLDDLQPRLQQEQIVLVSGYGRGFERERLEQILSQPTGRATVVLPMGIAAFNQSSRRLQPFIEQGQLSLISPFAPEMAYKEKLAQARNLLIDHLAMALVVANSNGAIYQRAQMTLQRGLSVFVQENEQKASHQLIEQGAFALTDPLELLELLQQAMIDETMLPSLTATPPVDPPPAAPTPFDPTDDYGLHGTPTEPLDPTEALGILGHQGKIPEVLRRRLAS